MRVLQIVPPQFFAEWRRRAVHSQGDVEPTTLRALAARVLREQAVVYREDWVLETLAAWEAVERTLPHLEYFAPIAHYPGFVGEVHWLIKQLECGDLTGDELPQEARSEVSELYTTYQALLQDYGVLDGAGQMQRALAIAQVELPKFLRGFGRVELVGLHDLNPLEREFLQAVTFRLAVVKHELEGEAGEVTVTAALDPAVEVEELARSVRMQLEEGISPREIAVAFPEPQTYAALLTPIFDRYGIPWNMPGHSLANLPLGRAVLALFYGEVEGWHKSHLQLLTAPGWGLPFSLTEAERRALRTAPPLEGLPAWEEHLGHYQGWADVLELLRSAGQRFRRQSLAAHARSLQRFLEDFPPERWSSPDLLAKAELLKSWDALQYILQDLDSGTSVVSLERFAQLLKGVMEDYQVRPPRVLADQVAVLRINELGAARLKALHVGGLVQGDFPRQSRQHWLTRLKAKDDAQLLYKLMIASAERVHLYYPETDHEGKLNLPATVIPPAQRRIRPPSVQGLSGTQVQASHGLADQEAVQAIRDRILAEGLSVSQLNLYARCPFQFFCTFVLGLQALEEESLELSPLDEGLIIHRTLQRFWENHTEGPLPEIPEGQREVERLLREHFEGQGLTVPNRLLKDLRRFIRKDLELAGLGWRPAYLEKRFRGLMIPLHVDGAEYQVELRGVIDRIDRAPDGSYVLYDYKTGGAPTAQEVRTGADLQIATYLMAAQVLLPNAENVGVAYYLTSTGKRVGIFREDWVKALGIRRSENCLSGEAFQAQVTEFEKRIREVLLSIFAGEFPAKPSGSRTCSYCPYPGISRREVGIG